MKITDAQAEQLDWKADVFFPHSMWCAVVRQLRDRITRRSVRPSGLPVWQISILPIQMH